MLMGRVMRVNETPSFPSMEEEIRARVIADLEEANNSQTPILHSTISHLQSLIDANDPSFLERFFEDLAVRSMTPSSALLPPLSSAMDGGSTPSVSLSASKLYLSLLLIENSSVFSLFTPMAFLSLLRSIRRSFKKRVQETAEEESQVSGAPINQRKKGGKRSRGLRKNQGDDEAGGGGFDVRVLLSVLERLELVISTIHLDRFPDSLKSLIQAVAEIPITAIEMLGSSSSYGRLLDSCSRILTEALKCDNEGKEDTAAELLKSLTPLILMAKSQAKTFALGFVKSTMMGFAKESEGIKKAVVNLPKYLVHKSPEKAEPRGLAVETITDVVKSMEFEDEMRFVRYVVKMTKGNTSFRLLAVDLILMLMMSLGDPLGVDSGIEVQDSWGLSFLDGLIQRCSDVNGGIRARALSNLAQLVAFLSTDDRNKAILKEALGFGEAGHGIKLGNLNDLLRKRCMDDKSAVRKAALHLVTKLTTLLGGSFDEVVLKMMGMACSDPLVSIRKAAISAISEAFRASLNETVIAEWLHSIPRLITDNESSVQEECENLFLELVLDRVSGISVVADKSTGSENTMDSLFPEGILILLKEICNEEVMPWVKKICTNLGKKKRLKPKIVVSLQNMIKSSESIWLSNLMPIEKWTSPIGVWFLLSEMSAYLPEEIDLEFLYHHWKLLDNYDSQEERHTPLEQPHSYPDEGIESSSVAWAGDRVFLLQTISNVSMELTQESAADLAHNLLLRVEDFNMHSTEVNAHVKALRTLCNRKALSSDEAANLVAKWVKKLLSKAFHILKSYISDDSQTSKDRTFLTPPIRSGKDKKAEDNPRSLSQAVTAVYTIGSLVIVCPSADMNSIIPLLHTVITSGNSDPSSIKIPGNAVSFKQKAPSLYIQAWLTMGKICLADGKHAERYIPLFVQELEKSDSAALRNDLVVIMADFCVRYTAVVDGYISKITKCLRDPCELVRRQTFMLLSRLLQRDYVKWRGGVLFLRFLLSLADESEKIRQLADYLFGHILKVKAPLLPYNSFVEAVLVLNDCSTHSCHDTSKISKSEKQLFSIRGNDEDSRSRRMRIYLCLLKQMAPEHLLATFAKLCAEILAAASDGNLKIDDVTGQSVLQDTFRILSCKEIKIQSTRVSSSDTGDMDDETTDNAAAAAKGKVITQAVRKGIIQNTIPIFIELKRLLESQNSPLIGSLMECLRIILKDYKNDIEEILVADKQLQKELVYDMQKYEAAKARSTANESFRSPEFLRSKMQHGSKLASAMGDVVAAATAKSVLRGVNKGALTPPLSSVIKAKLKSVAVEGPYMGPSCSMPSGVLESLRRRQSFDSDDDER